MLSLFTSNHLPWVLFLALMDGFAFLCKRITGITPEITIAAGSEAVRWADDTRKAFHTPPCLTISQTLRPLDQNVLRCTHRTFPTKGKFWEALPVEINALCFRSMNIVHDLHDIIHYESPCSKTELRWGLQQHVSPRRVYSLRAFSSITGCVKHTEPLLCRL